MNNPILATLIENYRWDLSLYTFVGIIGLSMLGARLIRLVPALRSADDLNVSTYKEKMVKPRYAANQKWNMKWGLFFTAIIFVAIMPFCLTLAPQPLWSMMLDMVVILMVYDFFYYLTHRFVFHDAGFLGGPLIWMHAVHHRQHNPCRRDSSYIHPLEVFLGLGLYVATIALLPLAMGKFHVATIIITWIAFQQINLHNHDRWETDKFPYKYLSYAAKLHHFHHAKFTGGNFATITPLYDWMFGTLDNGEGGKSSARKLKDIEAQTEAAEA
ncbi:MAG: sterol desaturase family protein [Novosphingobium sp.]|nr:sterol desaturase family protein [Novosphingobium sp.]